MAATRLVDADGNTVDPWEMSLREYLDLKPAVPAQRDYWRRVHLASVAGAVRSGRLSRETALEDYSTAELEEADRVAAHVREVLPKERA